MLNVQNTHYTCNHRFVENKNIDGVYRRTLPVKFIFLVKRKFRSVNFLYPIYLPKFYFIVSMRCILFYTSLLCVRYFRLSVFITLSLFLPFYFTFVCITAFISSLLFLSQFSFIFLYFSEIIFRTCLMVQR